MSRKILLCFLLFACTAPAEKKSSEVWITTPDKSKLLSQAAIEFAESPVNASVIKVDTSKRYQTMDGFGFTLTGGSAQLIYSLEKEQRLGLLTELFGSEKKSIGISYLRVSIGASDLDDYIFSYDDLMKGETDENLSSFTLDPDRRALIPVLKEIISINPKIKIMGSPWSPPVWMKDNQLPKGGKLLQAHYAVYARYLLKYILEMKEEGIVIDAITIQNEPENPGNTPSMVMTSEEQNVFIREHLGPLFSSESITTKIILFDHNCDHPKYPISILNDPETRKFVDGTAFHMYLGEISAMDSVHSVHPDKNIYFTEQWTSGKGEFGGDLRWHIKNLVIGAPRNWSKTVLEWNLAADEKFEPHTNDGGCTICQGALTIDSKSKSITRNVSYYIIAHASKFVPAGSTRIESSVVDGLINVAYLTPDGKKVMIILNDSDSDKNFSIECGGKYATATLGAGAAGTFIW